MSESSADLLITGRIATLAGDSGFGWVEALAIQSDRVIAAGRRDDLESLAGPATQKWRLPDDRVVLPGITDAHLHLMTMTVAGGQIDLNGADLDQALALIAERHADMVARGDADGWLLGHGWQIDLVGGWPTAAHLDRAAPGRPIALWTHDHHSRWLSSRAMELAGIEEMPRDGLGVLIRRDDAGRATGILHEGGCMLVDAAIPPPTGEQLHANLKLISADLLALGLTGVHDPGELTGDTDVAARTGLLQGSCPGERATSARPFLGALVAAGPSHRARLPQWPVDRSLSDGLAEALRRWQHGFAQCRAARAVRRRGREPVNWRIDRNGRDRRRGADRAAHEGRRLRHQRPGPRAR